MPGMALASLISVSICGYCERPTLTALPSPLAISSFQLFHDMRPRNAITSSQAQVSRLLKISKGVKVGRTSSVDRQTKKK